MSDCWSRDKLNFDVLEKGLGFVSPPYFMYDFSEKILLISQSNIFFSGSIDQVLMIYGWK